MAKKRMGFAGKLNWGAIGSSATTELTEARDVSYNIESTEADVSDRASIFDLMDVAGVKFSLEFEVSNLESSAFVAAARAAVVAGTGMAFVTADDYGGWGVDADFVISIDESQPLRDAQRIKIKASPTDKNGRTPEWGTQTETTTAAP